MNTKLIVLAISALFAGTAGAQTITETPGGSGAYDKPNVAIDGNANGTNTIAPTGIVQPNGQTYTRPTNPDGTPIVGGAFAVFGTATGVNSIQIGGTSSGSPSIVSGPSAIGIGGDGLIARGAYSTAVGSGSIIGLTRNSDFASAFGAQSFVNNLGGTALGSQSVVQGIYSVAIGAGSRDGGQSNVVSFGMGGQIIDPVTGAPYLSQAPATRRLINVSNGIAATDAATVGQVNSSVTTTVNSAVAAMKSYTDATVNFAATSTLQTANTYAATAAAQATQTANTYTDAKVATAAPGTPAPAPAPTTGTLQSANSYTDAQVSNSVVMANSYTDRTNAATVNASKAYSDAGFTNALASANRYTDDANAATLSASRSYTDKVFGSFDDKLNQVDRRASQGVAAAMAMMQMPVSLSTGETAMTAGVGSYRGFASIAFGLHHMTSRDEMVSAGVAITGDQAAFRVGGSFKFK